MPFLAMPRCTVFVAYEGIQLLDIIGPVSVLDSANKLLGRPVYELVVASPQGGLVKTGSGLSLATEPLSSLSPHRVDAFFVSGAEQHYLPDIMADDSARAWANQCARRARRYGSTCFGSAVLAAWNLIGTRRFTSHWGAAGWFAREQPRLHLDIDALFVEDGPLWTSAGVTAGIDMAMALVERDHGPALASDIAKLLVISIRRPATQHQHHAITQMQYQGDARYRNLIGWITLNLNQPLSIDTLAERAAESPRSFQRNFTATTGQSPGHFVAALRLDRACTLMDAGVALQTVARETGFPNVARLSASLRRRLGVTAQTYQQQSRARQGAQAAACPPVPVPTQV